MRITIFAAGSRGDVQPCAVLGRGLQQDGFEVLLAAPENFGSFIHEYGLGFHPLRGDVQAIMASETGKEFMERSGGSLLQSIRAMRTMLEPVIAQMVSDAWDACQEADALISLAVFAGFARSIAEARRIPLILVEPTPVLPTRAFPAPGWHWQKNLGGLHNLLSGRAMLQVLWSWYSPFVNSFRRQQGLPAFTAASFYKILTSTPLLGAYSDTVIPRPPDWPATAQITGYWFQEPSASWQPESDLRAFLEAGEPPVYVGFGSMAGENPQELAGVVLEALARCSLRGLLLTGWGGMQALNVPETVCVVDGAPHGGLFPRMAAVVHHGGAGTTAEGLRAGVPSLILPFAVDQAFWGKRVKDLGAGPAPIPIKKLTVDRLAQALDAAVRQPRYKQRAAEIGSAIRAQDGVGQAVRLIRQQLEG
jgi:sterol 3beta-glucosyltransferase